MNKIYSGALFLCSVLGVSAQEVVWQKDIKSSTQDFLSQITTTIDQQYLVTGSSIPSRTSGNVPSEAGGNSQMPAASSRTTVTIFIWLNSTSRAKRSGKNIFQVRTMIFFLQR